MTTTANMTPADAKKALAALAPQLQTWRAGLETAKEQLDEPAQKIAMESLAKIGAEAIELTKSITDCGVSPGRARLLVEAAAAGLSPAQLKKIAQAWRVGEGSVILPAGKYEALSRGKGWCRLGTGSNAKWGSRVDGGYMIEEGGKWTVGSSDGFSRKDSDTYKAEEVGAYLIASHV